MRDLFRRFFSRTARDADAPPELARARQLIAAIDAGGIPLDPGRITRIAEDLGLEVSRREGMDRTIERIRAALGRVWGGDRFGTGGHRPTEPGKACNHAG